MAITFQHHHIDRAVLDIFYLSQQPFWNERSKDLEATLPNVLDYSMGFGEDDCTNKPEESANYFTSSYDEYLACWHLLAQACNLSHKYVIMLIWRKVVLMNQKMHTEVAAGTRERHPTLQVLDKSTRWGRAVYAVAEAFEFDLQEVGLG
jgi:hypothetical protein